MPRSGGPAGAGCAAATPRPRGPFTGRPPGAATRAPARLFGAPRARLVARAADIGVGGRAPGAVEPPLPNPEWTRWDHDEAGVWPRIPYFEGHDESRVPQFVVEVAARVRERLAEIYLPRVLGHADWES